mgnify:CR=1 FL=1|jgi:hypothetical protein
MTNLAGIKIPFFEISDLFLHNMKKFSNGMRVAPIVK